MFLNGMYLSYCRLFLMNNLQQSMELHRVYHLYSTSSLFYGICFTFMLLLFKYFLMHNFVASVFNSLDSYYTCSSSHPWTPKINVQSCLFIPCAFVELGVMNGVSDKTPCVLPEHQGAIITLFCAGWTHFLFVCFRHHMEDLTHSVPSHLVNVVK